MEKSAELQNFIDSLHYDLPKKWINRFDFTKIKKYSDVPNKWFIPCVKEQNYNYHDIMDQKWLYPDWCDIKALDEFAGAFTRKEYKIEKRYENCCGDVATCYFSVTYGNLTINFQWEQW